MREPLRAGRVTITDSRAYFYAHTIFYCKMNQHGSRWNKAKMNMSDEEYIDWVKNRINDLHEMVIVPNNKASGEAIIKSYS